MIIKSIVREDFFDYLHENWTDEIDKSYIDNYQMAYSGLGKGIGLYNKEKLVGFIFYKENIERSFWFKNIQWQRLDFTLDNLSNVWENVLLEIHPNYRFNGLGSILLKEVYNRMPDNYILISLSEHTNKEFYLKNGFTQLMDFKHSRYYLFLKNNSK